MNERFPADQAAREQAIDPRRSFIVQAPAGSGKTSLLTDRIIALLAQVQRPEQIVAMTFTRKAAGEMQNRVLEKLEHARHAPEPETAHERRGWQLAQAALAQDQRLGWRLLEQPSRLRIQTIDSFCASLVKAMPWFSALGGMPSISTDARELYETAATRVLAMAGENAAVDILLRHLDLDLQAATHALSDMLACRDQWLPLIGLIYHDQAPELLEQSLHETIARQLADLIDSMPAGWQHQLADSARAAATELLTSTPGHDIVALLDWQAGELLDDPEQLPQWRGLAQLLLTADGSLRQKLDKRTGCSPKTPHKETLTEWLGAFSVGEAPLWCQRLQAIRDIPEPVLTQAQREILLAQAEVLILTVAQLQLEFTAKAEVDFIEVAQRATMALGRADDPSDLLLRLDQQIEHLLIDEFQDTSKAQLDLLETLTSGWQAGDGKTLFVVGDPMQSIYRFRKAEVGLFLRVREQGLGAVALEPLTLSENFRSSGSIVNWVNLVFAGILPDKDSDELGAIRYSPSVAWHAESDQPAVDWHLQPTQEAVEDRVVALATQAWETYVETDKPVAILVKSRSHLGRVTRSLRRAGLPTRAIDLEALGESPVVMDLLALARALAHAGDRAAWVAVLRAPWCGLSLSTLHHVLWHRPRHTVLQALARWLDDAAEQAPLPEDQRTRLLAVAPILIAADRDDGRLPFAARLETLWRALDGHRLLHELSDAEDAQAFFELIDEVAEHSYLDVDLLQTRLDQLFAQPVVDGDRAIEVMTMHKAKGLEFESVILMGLERTPPVDRAPLVRIEQVDDRLLFGPVKPSAQKEQDPISMYLGQREQARQVYETDRLLYVAATRARQQLHLVARVQPDTKTAGLKTPASRTFLSRLWGFCPTPVIETALAQMSFEDDEAAPEAQGDEWVAPAMHRRQAMKPASVPVPSEASMPVQMVWHAQDSGERLVGTLLHAWFAYFLRTGRRSAPDQPQIVMQLARLGMATKLRESAAQQVMAGIEAMLTTERGLWLLSQAAAKVEWALVDSDEVVSVLDLAIDQDSHWLVVDYKTTRMQPGEDQARFVQRMSERYRAQMQRYVEQLQALDGRQAQAALYFPLEDLWVEMRF